MIRFNNSFQNLKNNFIGYDNEEVTLLSNTIREDIKIVCCSYNINTYHKDLFNTLEINMPITIQHSVNKRQADFLAGRYAAKSILTQFGINNIDVPIGVHRSPVWPKNINGSISHTHDRAICIASTNYAHKFIGCDIELLISNQTRVEIGDSIIDNYEKEILIKAFNDVNIAYVIVFSAKESLFKALYPTVNEYFDFDTAQLVDIDIKNQRFKIKLVKPLHSILPKGKVFLGYYFIGNGVVTTVVIE